MPKNRDKIKANKRREQMLDKRNAYGMRDPTPYEAVKHIREKQLRERRESRWNAST